MTWTGERWGFVLFEGTLSGVGLNGKATRSQLPSSKKGWDGGMSRLPIFNISLSASFRCSPHLNVALG